MTCLAEFGGNKSIHLPRHHIGFLVYTWRMQRICDFRSSLIHFYGASTAVQLDFFCADKKINFPSTYSTYPYLLIQQATSKGAFVPHRRPPRPLPSRTTARRSSMRPGTRVASPGRGPPWRRHARPCPSTTTPSKPWTVWTRRTSRRREVTTKSISNLCQVFSYRNTYCKICYLYLHIYICMYLFIYCCIYIFMSTVDVNR